MADLKQLPFLLKLIDDESPMVRERVWDELESFGPSLECELDRLADPPDDTLRFLLRDLILNNRKTIFRKNWLSWLFLHDDKVKLEHAFSLLSDYMNGESYPVKLIDQLDELAADYNAIHEEADVTTLARFLFETKGLSGADTDYYNPYNNDLVYVIQTRNGLPITLACIYMLVGRRLGLHIEGCNMPGHFFARVIINNRIYLVDCFNNGQFFHSDEFHPFLTSESRRLRNVISSPPDAETVFRRVIMNLVRAYQHEEDKEECQFFIDRLNELNNLRKS
ncbi:transglutaminase family protein [candidate division KSB1 bacterium]